MQAARGVYFVNMTVALARECALLLIIQVLDGTVREIDVTVGRMSSQLGEKLGLFEEPNNSLSALSGLAGELRHQPPDSPNG
jgi:hypothetical protein